MANAGSKDGKNASQRVRDWTGPGVFTYGYRPFFLLAGIWASLSMVAWVAMLIGWTPGTIGFDPISWHAHEMLFGFVGAVLAGFLLTAVPNWTGRLPIIGWPLAALSLIWCIGRLAIFVGAALPAWGVALADLMFPVVLAVLIAREILAGKNWRNLVVLAMLVLFILSNLLFHITQAQSGYGAGSFGFRLGLGSTIMLIIIIGGRIVPSFTRNWMVKRGETALPVPMNQFDKAVLLISGATLLGWSVWPYSQAVGGLAALAGVLNVIRLGRWCGLRTLAEPLLWILHVGYAFVPLGFLSLAAAIFELPFSPMIGAEHLWMAGAIGVMTLAMMTRASLGHAGRPLEATPGVARVYGLILIAIVMRYLAAMGVTSDWALWVSAICWIAGFAGFVVLYWPILTQKRA